MPTTVYIHASNLPASHTPARPLNAYPTEEALYHALDSLKARQDMTRLSGIPPDPRYIDIIQMDRLNRGVAASDISLERRGTYVVNDRHGPALRRNGKLPPLPPPTPKPKYIPERDDWRAPRKHTQMTGPAPALHGGAGPSPQDADPDGLRRRLRTTEFEMRSAADSNAEAQPQPHVRARPTAATTPQRPAAARHQTQAHPLPARPAQPGRVRRKADHPTVHAEPMASAPAEPAHRASASAHLSPEAEAKLFQKILRRMVKTIMAEEAEKATPAAAAPVSANVPPRALTPDHHHAQPTRSAMHDPAKPSIHAAGRPSAKADQPKTARVVPLPSAGRWGSPADPLKYTPPAPWYPDDFPANRPRPADVPGVYSAYRPSTPMLPRSTYDAPWGTIDRDLYDYYRHPDPRWDSIMAWAREYNRLADQFASVETAPPSSAWADKEERDEAVRHDEPEVTHRFSIRRAGPKMHAAQEEQRKRYPAPAPAPDRFTPQATCRRASKRTNPVAVKSQSAPAPDPAAAPAPATKPFARMSRAEYDREIMRLMGVGPSTRIEPQPESAAVPAASRPSQDIRPELEDQEARLDALRHRSIREGKKPQAPPPAITVQAPSEDFKSKPIDSEALHAALDRVIRRQQFRQMKAQQEQQQQGQLP